jgi:two-component sensor histidine kinase
MSSFQALPARVSFRLVLASILGVWVTYFVIATLRGWVIDLEMTEALLWRRIFVILASMVVTLGLWPLLRLLDFRSYWIKGLAVLLLALPASLGLAAINYWVFAPIEEQVTTRIGEREGLRVRSDESGNLLIDPLERANEAAPTPTPTPAPPPKPAPKAQPTEAPSALPAAQKNAAITIDAQVREDNRWRQLTDVALGRYFLLLAWAALYFALVNAEQARAAERREGEYRRAAKAAELRSLRYQVNPHFLFNTLNSLSALVLTGKAQAAEQMIQTLSTFYRRSLAEDPTGMVSLEAEVTLQRAYLEIEAVRFPERLVAEIDVPADLLEAQVPGMILQPLVENSVKYGVAPVNRAVAVRIAAREEFGRLVLEVSDNGPGSANMDNKRNGLGIGLTNVRDRLEARYGDAASLVSGPAEGGGWRTVIRLPLERHHD